MIDDGRRASDVIRKLRALSKRAEVQPEPEDLDEILEDTLTLVQRELLSCRARRCGSSTAWSVPLCWWTASTCSRSSSIWS